MMTRVQISKGSVSLDTRPNPNSFNSDTEPNPNSFKIRRMENSFV